ncbi:hypothetical protein Tco_1248993 [Tanacetum coccineum]
MAALQYKDDHNKIAFLGRERGCEDFTDILSYLDHSPLRKQTRPEFAAAKEGALQIYGYRASQAHNGTITMTAVKAMTKQQLIEEYDNKSCKPTRKDRLLSAHYNSYCLMIPDSAGGGGSNPAGSAFGTPVTDSTVPTPAAMDSAGSHHEIGISPFADSADSSSPSNVSTDHIPIDGLFVSTSVGRQPAESSRSRKDGDGDTSFQWSQFTPHSHT